MAFPGSIVSPQYRHGDKITVTIIEAKSPAHYVVKESAGVNSSSEAKLFAEAESQMQELFSQIEPTFFPMPMKNAIVIVFKNDNFYRGRVLKIICMSEGYLIRVYLVDYGYECSVPRNCMYQIPERFLKIPFQAVELKLNNINPITLVMDPVSLEMNYGPVDDWDPSALTFVTELKEGMVSAYMMVKKVGLDFVCGSLFMTFQDNQEKCINDALVLKKYAQYIDLDVQDEDNFVSKEDLKKLPTTVSNSLDRKVETLSLETASHNNLARLSKINELMKSVQIRETSPKSSDALQKMSLSDSVKSPSKNTELAGSQIILNEMEETPKASKYNIPSDEVTMESKCGSSLNVNQFNSMSKPQTLKPETCISHHSVVDSTSNMASPSSLSNTPYAIPKENTQSLIESNSTSKPPSSHLPSDQGSNTQNSSIASNFSERRRKLLSLVEKSEKSKSPTSDSKSMDSCSPRNLTTDRKHKMKLLLEKLEKRTDQKSDLKIDSTSSIDTKTFKSPTKEEFADSHAGNTQGLSPLTNKNSREGIESKEVNVSERLELLELLKKRKQKQSCASSQTKPLNVSPLEDNLSKPSHSSPLVCSKENDIDFLPGELKDTNPSNMSLKSPENSRSTNSIVQSPPFRVSQLIKKHLKTETSGLSHGPVNSCSLKEKVSSESFNVNSTDTTRKPLEIRESNMPLSPPISKTSVPSSVRVEKSSEPQDFPKNSFRSKLKMLLDKQELGSASVTKSMNTCSPESTNKAPNASASRTDSPQGRDKAELAGSPVAPHFEKQSSDNGHSPASSFHCSSEEESSNAKILGKRSYETEFNRNKFFKPRYRIGLESAINRKTEGVINQPLENFDASEEKGQVNQEGDDIKCDEQILTSSDSSSEVKPLENIEKSSEVEVSETLQECINKEEADTKCEEHTLTPNDCTSEAIPLENIEKSTEVNVPGMFLEDIKEEWVGDKSLWDRQGVPALCIGKATPKPILSLSAMAFPNKLMKILDGMKLMGPSSIQSVLWPAMSRGRSIVAVAPPHSGKTVGFLLPIAAKLFDLDSILIHNAGPLAVVICSSWIKAHAVYSLLKSFLKGLNVRILLHTHDGEKIGPKMNTLRMGCEILITVPSYMLEFLRNDKINIQRCTHVILDDGDSLLTHNKNELQTMMNILLHEIWRMGSSHLKFVLCTERWTKTAASFVNHFMDTPLMFFTSFLEAAIFSKVPIHPHVCDESKKNIELLKILETSKRAVVCSTNCETTSSIHRFLRCENVRSYLVNETQEHYISDGVIQDWKSVTSSAVPYCLVISDNALSKMSISDAHCLIHYDIPELSRLQFGNRFSSIAEHFPKQAEDQTCESHILMTENCSSQALPLMKIVKRSKVEVPEILLELIKTETKKHADSQLCNTFKAFGVCNIPKCPGRHFIDPVSDEPKALIKDGDIQALISHVFDASHFVVRILKHMSSGAEDITDMGIKYIEIPFALKRFYSCEANRVLVENPVVGGHYVYQEQSGMFYRVKVLSKTLEECDETPKLVLLFEDEGWVKNSDTKHLYEYDNSLDLGLPHAVEVFLSNLCTPDYSYKWHPLANSYMKNLIENQEINGKIVLCLGETLWLNPVIIKEKGTNFRKYKESQTLENLLVTAEYAVLSKVPLQNLTQACGDIVPLPKTQDVLMEPQNVFGEEFQIQYSFLPMNEYEDVYVSSIISPHQFYVQRSKFSDCLDDLLDRIESCIKEKSLKKCRNVLIGMHCIAPFSEDNRYYRALVMDATDENEAQLFFVDFGDSERVSKDLIYVLPPKFLLLPFQAIECELNGICAAHGGWTEKIVSTLNDLTRNDDGDMIILKSMAYSKSCCYDGGYHYVVDLWSCEKSVSDQLLETGLVNPSEKATPCEVLSTPVDKPLEDELDGYANSDDEDLDPEDKEMKEKFCANLYKLMTQGLDIPNDSIPNIQEDLTDVDNPSDVNNHEIIDNPSDVNNHEVIDNSSDVNNDGSVDNPANVDEHVADFLENRCEQDSEEAGEVEEVLEIKPVIKQSHSQIIANALKLLAKRKPKTPSITWWDTDELVTVFIHLRDLKVYDLELYDTGFLFKASVRDVKYQTEESLYSNVHSNNTKTSCNVEGLIISFKKQETGRWPRLLKDSTKQNHIKYDLNHIDYSDTEEEPVSYFDPSQMVSSSTDEGNVSQTPDEDSSPDVLDDGDDDDEEDSVEPWRQLSLYRDPCDPLH